MTWHFCYGCEKTLVAQARVQPPSWPQQASDVSMQTNDRGDHGPAHILNKGAFPSCKQNLYPQIPGLVLRQINEAAEHSFRQPTCTGVPLGDAAGNARRPNSGFQGDPTGSNGSIRGKRRRV